MSLGERLTDLRKKHHLSQEEVAEKLYVTRQTISKWETDQSLPDFDKIIPLCNLYKITSDELLTGNKKDEKNIEELKNNSYFENKKKRTMGLIIGILSYFIALSWIMVSISVMMINPIVSSAIFLLICGIGTSIIIYTTIMYKKEKTKKEEKDSKLYKQIDSIVSTLTVIIYLLISFITMAWHLTWIIWLIYALVMEIIKLIISLRGDDNEK